MNAAEWAEYMARNRRAVVEYALRPSIVAAVLDDFDSHGMLGRTSRRFNLHIGSLIDLVPEIIDDYRARLHLVQEPA